MLAGLLIAAVALVVIAAVAWPLLARAPGTPPPDPRAERRRAIQEDLDRSLEAIREIEMDHRAGNLSAEDFAALDQAERARAVELMRRRDRLEEE